MRFISKTLARDFQPASENRLAENTHPPRRVYFTMKRLLLAFFFLAGWQAEAGPVEMGTVKRSPDLEKSLAFSKESGKPVLILPQEIPE